MRGHSRKRWRRSITFRKLQNRIRRELGRSTGFRRVIRRPQQFIMAQLDPAEWLP